MTGAITTWRAIGAVLAAQVLVLADMVWDRITLLNTGREVVLDVIPVDPRSLFRGDYVILNYDISRFDGALVDGNVARGATIYVTIAKDAAGKWKVVRASGEMPRGPGAGEVVLKARSDRWRFGPVAANATIQASYGIESYFIPEGTGRELERLVGEKRIRAVVAVGRDGTAALKGLEADGKLVHREPLI